MTDQTNDFPADIMRAAKECYESMPLVYDGWDEDAVILCIARTLMAERGKWANILTACAPFVAISKLMTNDGWVSTSVAGPRAIVNHSDFIHLAALVEKALDD